MANPFFQRAFTANVKTVQARMGSREGYGAHDQGPEDEASLGPNEIAFLTTRDSFYQGTVGETGWPYVQHRGGPCGFIKVLDAHTIGYADFSGNRQYISTGNLAGNDRVCLFLMDYPNQARLKILGRARVIDADSEPGVLALLDNPHYRARVERGVVIHIEAFDWNCPKYITPRYTKDEIAQATQLAQAARTTSEVPPPAHTTEAIGQGELALTITGMRQLTPRIRAFELAADDQGALPPFEAGAHLEIPVALADGTVVTRQYSLMSQSGRRDGYEIAVLLERDGRGGSRAIHAGWQLGTRLRVPQPANHFPLHADSRPAILIAGGIGITPIRSMAQTLSQRGVPFQLHYAGQSPRDMAYHDALAREYAGSYFPYFSRVPGQPRLEVESILEQAARDAVVYVCGPVRLIEAVGAAAARLGIAPERVQHETFQ